MKFYLIFTFLGAFLLQAAEMTLVRDGKPEAVILLDAEKNTKNREL